MTCLCGSGYYARLPPSGKDKWEHLKTQHLEMAKARIEEEKKAIAAARKVGWAVKKGVVPVNEAVKAYEEHLRLRVGLKESTRKEEAEAKRRGCRPRRWVVERTHSWFNRFRKLLVSFEKSERSYLGLTSLAAALICWRQTLFIYG